MCQAFFVGYLNGIKHVCYAPWTYCTISKLKFPALDPAMPLYPPVEPVLPCSLPTFFPLSRTEEPAKVGTGARDRRALQ